jgi:hypothetical protein
VRFDFFLGFYLLKKLIEWSTYSLGGKQIHVSWLLLIASPKRKLGALLSSV